MKDNVLDFKPFRGSAVQARNNAIFLVIVTIGWTAAIINSGIYVAFLLLAILDFIMIGALLYQRHHAGLVIRFTDDTVIYAPGTKEECIVPWDNLCHGTYLTCRRNRRYLFLAPQAMSASDIRKKAMHMEANFETFKEGYMLIFLRNPHDPATARMRKFAEQKVQINTI